MHIRSASVTTACAPGQFWRDRLHQLRAALRPNLPGRFQPYNHTRADRYPWLFGFAAEQLRISRPRLLSFGCSRGEEVLALQQYFPDAIIRGLDIAPPNIAKAGRRLAGVSDISLAVAADCSGEPDAAYDAIFCLAVLCHGDLVAAQPMSCGPLIQFDAFERQLKEFDRCLKPGGLLFLHTCNFRLCDTGLVKSYDPVLHAKADDMAADRQYDRHNRLIEAPPYQAVGFRKKSPDGAI